MSTIFNFGRSLPRSVLDLDCRRHRCDSLPLCFSKQIRFLVALKIDMHTNLPPNPTSSINFVYKSFAVAAAVNWAVSIQDKPKRIVVFDDSENFRDVFLTLKARGRYSDLLRTVARTAPNSETVRGILDFGLIRGADEGVADALSHRDAERVINQRQS